MWIMLTTKLSTRPSPPKLSIFWSTPWPNEEIVLSQFERHFEYLKETERNKRGYRNLDETFFLDAKGNKLSDEDLKKKILVFMETQDEYFWLDNVLEQKAFMGKDPNWARARKIRYQDDEIRVFPHEFSVLTHENMSMYIGYSNPEEGSHELVSGNVAETKLLQEVLEGDLREVYNAALVDGCSHSMAIGMALGIDVSDTEKDGLELAKFPPVGWYRCKPEYASFYCDEREMKEDF